MLFLSALNHDTHGLTATYTDDACMEHFLSIFSHQSPDQGNKCPAIM